MAVPQHVHLAEFIAQHIAQLLERRNLVNRVADLEARRRLQLARVRRFRQLQ